ncbi:hypothetical protein IC744_00105 [Microbacterium hominis]|uniref:hypothetical protein n=1 Tax=Microbacterium TaxID=33882 RepID=UPI00168BFF7D|nr:MULTISPECIES: hypothetical protein [Microbacterium]QOC24861.1 hypothetical protein IC745_10750 [Microbacterium hominis]QOC28914.1 hypothetical protein IC744_00105 [Microbacterium hominis]QYF98887.1 hypothetical protein KY498_06645 [Microbacterium sp. PAMC21962]
MRLSSAPAKAGVLFVGLLVVVSGGLLFIAADFTAGLIWTVLTLLALTVVAARTFRGEHEGPSRPLWQMTAEPTASYVIGVILLVQSGYAMTIAQTTPSPWAVYIAETVLFLLGLAFVNSGLRLTRAANREAKH